MSKSKMTNDRGQTPNPKGQTPNPKDQIPNSKPRASSDTELDDAVTGGQEEAVEIDRTEGGGHGRPAARLKGVQKRKRAQRRAGCEVLAFKLRLVETESDGCEE
jgi:hypothetical protein